MVSQWAPLVCIGDEFEFFETFTTNCIVSNFVIETNATNLAVKVRLCWHFRRFLQFRRHVAVQLERRLLLI